MSVLIVFTIAIFPIFVLYMIMIIAKAEKNRVDNLKGNFNKKTYNKTSDDDVETSYREIYEDAVKVHVESGCHCSFCGSKLYKGEVRCSLCGKKVK